MNVSKQALALALILLAGIGCGTAEAQVYRYDYPHAHAQSTPGYAVRNPYQYRQYYHAGRSAYHYGRAGAAIYGATRSKYFRPRIGRELRRGYDHMTEAYYNRAMRRSYVPPRSPWD